MNTMKVFTQAPAKSSAIPIQMHTDTVSRKSIPFIRRLLAPYRAPAQAHLTLDIPAAFSEDQSRLIIALKDLGMERNDASWLLWASPTEFSQAQVQCVLDMLALNAQDFCATMADAMAPCALRGQLLRGRGFEDDEVCRLRRQVALELG